MAKENETIADIIAEKRREADYIEETARGLLKAGENYDGIAYTESDLESALDLAETKRKKADRLEAALRRELETKDSVIQTLSAARDDELDRHRREIDALKQRRTELNAEVAAKDAVIMRLNDAIAEEQKRQLATTENPSAVGDAAKLREALENMVRAETHGSMERDDLCGRCLEKMFARCNHDGTCWVDKAITALAAPPRNCDRFASAEEAWDAYDEWVESYRSKGKTEPFNEFGWLFAPAPEKEGGAK